jgi:hypothetical protein
VFGFFTSCDGSKGDPDIIPEETTWKDGVGSYTGEALSAGSSAVVPTDASVELDASGEKAKITLTGFIPEAAAVEFNNVDMKKETTGYVFSASTKIGTTTVGIEGTLSGIPATKAVESTKKISIAVTRTIDAAIAGTKKLILTEGEAPVADFRLDTDIQFSSPATTVMLGAVPQLVGAIIGEKVSEVNVILDVNGTFDVNWTKRGSTEKTDFKTALAEASGMPDEVMNLINIYYYTDDENIYLAMDKGTFTLMETAMASKLPEGMTFDGIKEVFFIDNGGFYALPVSMETDDDSIFFYMNKEKVTSALVIATPLLSGLIGKVPETMRPMVEIMMNELPDSLAAASKCNVGLGFLK